MGEALLGSVSVFMELCFVVAVVSDSSRGPCKEPRRSTPTTLPEPHICGPAACQSLRFMFGAQRDTSEAGCLALKLLFLSRCRIYRWEASLEGQDGFELEVFMQLLLKRNNQDTFHRFCVKNFNLSVFHLVGAYLAFHCTTCFLFSFLLSS